MSPSELYDHDARIALDHMRETSIAIDRRFKSHIRVLVFVFAVGVIPLLIAFATLVATTP